MKINRSATSPNGVKEDGLNIYLSVEEAKRIRAALSEALELARQFDAEELASYGGILEKLRLAIPQQWG
jgi:hypothetical protein